MASSLSLARVVPSDMMWKIAPKWRADEMAAVFEMTIDSETLSFDEIAIITGCSRRADQVAWLEDQGWSYVKTRAGEPVIGRLYARLKLAGISPQLLGGAAEVRGPDMSKIR